MEGLIFLFNEWWDIEMYNLSNKQGRRKVESKNNMHLFLLTLLEHTLQYLCTFVAHLIYLYVFCEKAR